MVKLVCTVCTVLYCTETDGCMYFFLAVPFSEARHALMITARVTQDEPGRAVVISIVDISS